ncbi:small integral membrane protein 42 [Diceros bicornis minor]|uniref:small integral membrane protein 42 n=1 Tax=Diceros bicornis minor TaxID=77932 RepID=UPI0026F26A10|nr:small integral membrane protein 42 [Diceros bicornis minor]
MSSPQLFLWDKGTLITAISAPAYLVKVLFFFALLITLVTLLILVWKVTKGKGNKNREPDLRKEATLLPRRSTVLGGDSIECLVVVVVIAFVVDQLQERQIMGGRHRH